MTSRTLVMLAAGCSAAATAHASVTPIAPFTGESWETFELIGPLGPTPGPAEIFDGQATIADQLAGMLMIANNLYSFLTDTEVLPYNGNLMGGLVTGFGVIDFETPVTDFGGYFNTADILQGGQIVFFDADGQNISTETLNLAMDEWEWYGWSSDTPISRIEIYGNETPGSPILLDDLQVNFIPTPATGALLGLAGIAACGRRRKA